jgi:hypothetical protein
MTPKSGQPIRSPRLLRSVACLAFLTAGKAQADIHYGIISTVRTSPKTTARLNLSAIGSDAALFTAFAADGNSVPVSDTVQMGVTQFASSSSSQVPEIQNLFVGVGNRTGLVRVEAVAGNRTSAMLEQSSLDGKVVLTLPPVDEVSGDTLMVAIGDLQQGTSLLVGNPNGTNNAFQLRYGTNLPGPPVLVPAFGVAVVDVTQANAAVIITAVDPSLPLIAQLAVDTGKTTVMTYLTPLR